MLVMAAILPVALAYHPRRPMRLLVITARYPTADRPAAGAFVRDRLDGVEADVIAPRHYRGSGLGRAWSVLWRSLTARGTFDGVECHFVLPTGPIALLAARLRRLPLVVYAHGGDVREMAARRWILRVLARLVVRRADAVVTNSVQTAAWVRSLGRDPEIVPPGLDRARFGVRPRPAERRVLYLGGATPGKGIEVARTLADTILGPGISEVSPAEVPALLAAHDVVLMPSDDEGFGLVAAEAIAAGRWVVARSVGGLRDVITDGINGTLVEDGDFAAALAAVPDYDPQTVAATAERFDVERHRSGMHAIWRQVLAVE
jgi:glycosyltransferase involved in cell wall biosynthesis